MENFVESSMNSSLFRSEESSTSWSGIDYSSTMSDESPSPVPVYHPTLGPQRDPLYIVLPITMIYLSILITGTIGNVSTCIVIARNKSMHTATNYYLFSLAVSDLLLLMFGLPVEVYLVWSKYSYVFGEIFCTLRGIAAECSTNASVLTITAFTVERYVAICHPFLSHTMSKLSRAIKLILGIWIVALCFAIPMALQFGVVRHELNPDISMCTFKNTIYEHSFEIATLLFFIVPMILITVLYVMIGIKLRQSNMMKRDNGRSRTIGDSFSPANPVGPRKERNCRHHTGRSSRRVLKMLVAVVVAFFLCWAPFHIQRLIYIYGTADDHLSSKNKWMEFLYILATYVSGVLYYVSATINPILYNIMSNKFREAFMETLGRTCGRSEFSGRQRSYSSLSRSQQRSAGGFLGSRAGGTVGTGLAQDSTDGSGNSFRDDNHYGRPPSVSARPEVATNLETRCYNAHRCVSNGVGRISAAPRKSSANDEGRICGETDFNFSNNSNRSSSIQGRTGDGSLAGERPDITTRLVEGGFRVSRNNSANATSINRHARNHNHHHNHRRNNQFRLGTMGNNAARRKKWWRIFKWLPDAKAFGFNSEITGNSRKSNVNDIESNRDEYAMTSRHIRNTGDQRPV